MVCICVLWGVCVCLCLVLRGVCSYVSVCHAGLYMFMCEEMHMCVCLCVLVHVCVCVYKSVYVFVCRSVYECGGCICGSVGVCLCVYLRVSSLCTLVCVCLSVCGLVHVFLCGMSVCLCLHVCLCAFVCPGVRSWGMCQGSEDTGLSSRPILSWLCRRRNQPQGHRGTYSR